MTNKRLTATPAGGCPAQSDAVHAWRHARRDSADLVSLRDGTPAGGDIGVTVAVGYCTECGTALLAIGPYGCKFNALPIWLELSAGFIEISGEDDDADG